MGSSGDVTTTTTAQPYGPSQPYLDDMLAMSANNFYGTYGTAPPPAPAPAPTPAPTTPYTGVSGGSDSIIGGPYAQPQAPPPMPTAQQTMNGGMPMGSTPTWTEAPQESFFQPTDYTGPSNVELSPDYYAGGDMIRTTAEGGTPLTDEAMAFTSDLMNMDYQTDQLEAVQQNALETAIPSATSMFAGSGMTNSSLAADTVGRAATDAVAPYEYAAYNNAQNLGLAAAGMAPTLEQAAYLPGTMMNNLGLQQYGIDQGMLDREMSTWYANEDNYREGYNNYLNSLLAMSGMGGTTSTTQPGPSMGQQIGGAAVGGLGMYGALGGPANPYAMPLAVGGSLLGLL